MLQILMLVITSIIAFYISCRVRENQIYVIVSRLAAGMTAFSALICLYRLDAFKEEVYAMKEFIEQHPYWIGIGAGIVLCFILSPIFYYISHREKFAERKRLKEEWKV